MSDNDDKIVRVEEMGPAEKERFENINIITREEVENHVALNKAHSEMSKAFYLCCRGEIAQHTAMTRIRKALSTGMRASEVEKTLLNLRQLINQKGKA